MTPEHRKSAYIRQTKEYNSLTMMCGLAHGGEIMSVCLSVCLSVCMSVFPPVRASFRLSVHMWDYWSVGLECIR